MDFTNTHKISEVLNEHYQAAPGSNDWIPVAFKEHRPMVVGYLCNTYGTDVPSDEIESLYGEVFWRQLCKEVSDGTFKILHRSPDQSVEGFLLTRTRFAVLNRRRKRRKSLLTSGLCDEHQDWREVMENAGVNWGSHSEQSFIDEFWDLFEIELKKTKPDQITKIVLREALHFNPEGGEGQRRSKKLNVEHTREEVANEIGCDVDDVPRSSITSRTKLIQEKIEKIFKKKKINKKW